MSLEDRGFSCQYVDVWVRNQDPNRECRGSRGESGWRTKAKNAEKANQTLVETNQDLLRRLDEARGEVTEARSKNLRLIDERGRLEK